MVSNRAAASPLVLTGGEGGVPFTPLRSSGPLTGTHPWRSPKLTAVVPNPAPRAGACFLGACLPGGASGPLASEGADPGEPAVMPSAPIASSPPVLRYPISAPGHSHRLRVSSASQPCPSLAHALSLSLLLPLQAAEIKVLLHLVVLSVGFLLISWKEFKVRPKHLQIALSFNCFSPPSFSASCFACPSSRVLCGRMLHVPLWRRAALAAPRRCVPRRATLRATSRATSRATWRGRCGVPGVPP